MRFSDVVGHGEAIGLLKKAISDKRLPHALIFAGPPGIGKRAMSFALATALNCPSFDQDACGVCAECQRMATLTHPNLTAIRPLDKDGEVDLVGGVVKIEQVRDVQSALRLKAESGWKVAIIECADRLLPAAQNALLKTLEEPPPRSIIALVTDRPSELLATVHSRCRKVVLRPLGADDVEKVLLEKGVEKGAARRGARLCAGSVDAALRLVSEGELEARDALLKRLSLLRPDDASEALMLAEELSGDDELDSRLEFIKELIRDRAVCVVGAENLALNCKEATGGQTRPHTDALYEAFSMVEGTRRDILPPRYANKQLALERLLVRLSALSVF